MLVTREALIVKLVAQVEEVTEVTEKLGRNSTNSHLPPSSDGPGAGARGVGRPPLSQDALFKPLS